jgi:hypothetical protein
MAEQTPRIKLFLAGACVSPDWSEKPVVTTRTIGFVLL